MSGVMSIPKRSPQRTDWHRQAEAWSVFLHASAAEAERVASGVPYLLAPADLVDPSSFAGRVVEECANRWGAVPEGGDTPICPHLPGSLNKRAVWVGNLPPNADPFALRSAFMPLLDLFEALEAVSGTRLASIVVVAPYADPTSGSAIVEATHRAVKSAALERGLLPGEFGRTLGGPGTRYGHIRTRQSGVGEYLALRRLLRQDRKYCQDNAQWLQRFEAMFGEAS